MEVILEYLRSNAPEQAWTWYEFAFGTGMRPSEQIAIIWDDLDWLIGQCVSSAQELGQR